MAGQLYRSILRLTTDRISECVVSAIGLKCKQMGLNPDRKLDLLQSFALSRGMAEQFWPMNLPSSGGRLFVHDGLDSAEVFRVVGCGFHQGQERSSSGPGVWGAEAKSCEAEFLGAGTFRVDGRSQ
jgi:hypothetical protein